jgi:outer membrane protein TolC
MHRRLAVLFVALAVSLGVGAQELTLADSVAAALGSNPEIRAASARAAAAAERVKGGKRHRLPRIGLSESFVYSNQPAEVFALSLNQGRFDLGEFFVSDPNDPEPLSTWISRVDLELPVYTGGKLSARIDQAKNMATSEELALDHTREKVAFETLSAYVNLARAREHTQLMEKTRATTSEHVRLAEQYVEQGLILEADLMQARVQLAHMDEMLTAADNGARLALAALNFQMGADQNLPRELKTIPPPPIVAGDLDGWIDSALEDRRDLAAARSKLAAGRLEQKAARPGYFPEIAVVGNYGFFDDRIFGANGHSGSIMAVARINLFGGGADPSASAAASHEAAGFEADIQRFEEGIALAVQQAWRDLGTARTRRETAHSALAAASEALRVRESRFKQGLDKMTDLLDAETALREAQTRELVARYDVSLHAYRLLFEAGASLISTLEVSR